MKVFELTLTQMLMLFTLILAGFILGKSRLVPEKYWNGYGQALKLYFCSCFVDFQPNCTVYGSKL